MWTVVCKEKAGRSAVPAIRSIMKTSGQPYLLYSDNGGEFCNDLIRNLPNVFEVRHARGRARNPWSQGQVELSNKLLDG